MSALLDEESTTVVLERLDFAAPCTSSRDHAAEVGLQCRGCGRVDLACMKHAQELRVKLEALVALGVWDAIVCIRCRHKGYTWDEVIRVVPL